MAVEITSPVSTNQMYETTFIVSPELSDGEYKKVADKFLKLIKDYKGEIINTEHWGQKKLAYPIARRKSGYYCYVEFQGERDFITKLDQEFRYDDNVMRFLTVKLDKHALEYNDKRRKQGFGKDKKEEGDKK